MATSKKDTKSFYVARQDGLGVIRCEQLSTYGDFVLVGFEDSNVAIIKKEGIIEDIEQWFKDGVDRITAQESENSNG